MNSKLLFVILSVALACTREASAPTNPSEGRAFASPEEAGNALIAAAAKWDVPEIVAIVGPDAKDLVASQDTAGDKQRAAKFVAKAREKHGIIIASDDPDRATLVVGNDDWPLPIPIERRDGKWSFDAQEGRDELLRRRIGSNELDVITICRGYADAQHDYASQLHDDSGVHEYAQKLVSSPGRQDGLAWQFQDGTWGGPVGETVAKAIEQGYKLGEGYHGYYFKVLKGQGAHAALGPLDYVIEGHMLGGFALLAWPVEYRVTGVKTFMVSWDGVVYEKDLGPGTAKVAPAIDRYDPDGTWARTDDEW